MARFIPGRPALKTYTVSGGTNGTQPTFDGDPLFTGNYVKDGPLVFFEVQVDFDNITSFGTGQYFVTLPFVARLQATVREGRLVDDSSGNQYHISGHVDAGSNVMYLFTTDNVFFRTFDFSFEQDEPITLTTADSFQIAGSYVC